MNTQQLDIFGKPLDYGTPDNDPPAAGHCCRAVALWWPFIDMHNAYEAVKRGEATFIRSDGVESPIIEDILTIGPMIRLVGVCAGSPLATEKWTEPRKVWRCIYNGPAPDFKCMIYDRRPQMCRRYPPNGKCEFTECKSQVCEYSAKEAKQPKHKET
jgi:Fe-S-cluster containining protein